MRRFIPGGMLAVLIAAAPSAASADCVCRARGVFATHGQTLCIWTPSGRRLARCEKVSNVASWTFLDTTCPLASLDSVAGHPAPLGQSVRLIR